jgi:AcrR family transcriptional regulator
MKRFDEIDLSIENVSKIIKYGFEVFANNEIEKVSTNVIVKKANISRGLLYYHFKDKDDLFDFLLYFSFKKSFVDIYDELNMENDDILERIKIIFSKRLEVVNEYPYLFSFSLKYVKQMKTHIKEHKFEFYREKMYSENIDKSLFINESDVDKSIKIVKWTFAGIIEAFILLSKTNEDNFEKAKLELEEYYLSLRRAFYIN